MLDMTSTAQFWGLNNIARAPGGVADYVSLSTSPLIGRRPLNRRAANDSVADRFGGFGFDFYTQALISGT